MLQTYFSSDSTEHLALLIKILCVSNYLQSWTQVSCHGGNLTIRELKQGRRQRQRRRQKAML